MIRKALAAVINNPTVPTKTAEEIKIEQLTKLLEKFKKEKTNGGGGGSGGGRDGKRLKKKDRPLLCDPDPSFNQYCSICGVNDNHGNDECALKHVKYWRSGATYGNRCGCSKNNLHKWHLSVKGQPVNYN